MGRRLEGEEGRYNIVNVGTFGVGAMWLEFAGSHMTENTRTDPELSRL